MIKQETIHIMSNNYIDNLMKNTYFMVCFDGYLSNGKKASLEICNKFYDDKDFQLSEYDKFKSYVVKCENFKLDYSIRIETFHPVDGKLECNYIKGKPDGV
tara:strand:+ start:50 stop:352 length:303 start_codon:yes stop_codon:yes gene_type:complete